MRSRLLQQTISLIVTIMLAMAYASSTSGAKIAPEETYDREISNDIDHARGDSDDQI